MKFEIKYLNAMVFVLYDPLRCYIESTNSDSLDARLLTREERNKLGQQLYNDESYGVFSDEHPEEPSTIWYLALDTRTIGNNEVFGIDDRCGFLLRMNDPDWMMYRVEVEDDLL